MKTLATLLMIVLFGAIVIPPILPKKYPPKAVIHTAGDIQKKEAELNNMISRIEVEINHKYERTHDRSNH